MSKQQAAKQREISWTDYPFGINNDNIAAVDPSTDQYIDNDYPEYFERLKVTATRIGIYISSDDCVGNPAI